jgi:hypothetical protein
MQIQAAIATSIQTNSTVTVEVDDRDDAIATMSALSESQLVQDGNTFWGDNGDDSEWAIRLA